MQPYVGFRTELKNRMILERIQNNIREQIEKEKENNNGSDRTESH